MLSIIHAAEVQFHFDAEARAREHAVLSTIRERRSAELIEASLPTGAPSRTLRTTTTWARPINTGPGRTVAACAVA